MSVDRKQFRKQARDFFEAFDRWQPDGTPPNVIRDLQSPEELALKAERYPDILQQGWEAAREKIDPKEDWDVNVFVAMRKMQSAALIYLFTGDKRAIAPAVAALRAFEACKRPYWTFSSCIGILDMDLRTAEVALSLAMMTSCMGDVLDASVHRRITELVLTRALRPGLEAERHKTYPWMHSRANWRIILCGCLATAGMVFHEDFPDYRELIDYGLEGVLVALEDGDRAGGWDEGPGYWNYGLSYAVQYASALRIFTGGQVDLFRHPFLGKTGDFWLALMAGRKNLWNWSDCGKQAGASLTLIALARVYQNPAYQKLVLDHGVRSLEHLWWFDPALKPKRPARPALTKRFPDLGLMIMRGGCGPRDPYVGIKAGDIPGLNYHAHLDQGSVVIFAEGRELLAELEKWPYPYEGDRKADGKKSTPGFYDEELKRLKRRDFDDVGALGHNIVTIEGNYPQPKVGVKSRFLRADSGNGYDVAVTDSTPFYRPLASRVRRYLVYLRPDVVLLVDEIRAREPVQARVLYHYLTKEQHAACGIKAAGARADFSADAFTITDGPAQLRWQSLHPQRDDHLVIGRDDRVTTYQPPTGLTERRNQYLYVQNLYRKPRLVFVGAMQFGKKAMRSAAFELEGQPTGNGAFTVLVRRSHRTGRIDFDLSKSEVAVAPLSGRR